MRGADEPDTGILELRTTSTTKNLHHIKNSEVNEFTLLGIVQLSALDNNSSSRKVNTPSKRSCTAEHFDQTFGEHAFHQVTVTSTHSCMVSTKAAGEQVTQLPSTGMFHVPQG